MRAVFQILTGHYLLHESQKLFFVIDPAGLDGGLAGNSMQNLIPDGIRLFPAGT